MPRLSLRWDGVVRGRVGRLLRCRSGATAIEAALVLPVFALMIGGIAETAFLIAQLRSLDNATEVASREVRVGNGATSAGDFKRFICDNSVVANCAEAISVKVVSAPELPQLEAALQAAENGNNIFSPGAPNSYVAVVVDYTWRPFLPGLSSLLGGSSNGVKFSSKTAFRREPQAG
ncbi:MAG: TadE/TadG family type IV pilus assembly protein [Hyphomicrobiales bacterium]